ncbi:MAG: hypothetical protein CL862_00380 [Cyanobium sp. NAT70]|nr:hypothetical protein [Cyanobium sp. NAT70]
MKVVRFPRFRARVVGGRWAEGDACPSAAEAEGDACPSAAKTEGGACPSPAEERAATTSAGWRARRRPPTSPTRRRRRAAVLMRTATPTRTAAAKTAWEVSARRSSAADSPKRSIQITILIAGESGETANLQKLL